MRLVLFDDEHYCIPDPATIWKLFLKKHVMYNQFLKRNLPTICHFLFYTTGTYLTNNFFSSFSYLLFHFTGFGSEKKLRIRPDPDPQYCC